jgi:AmiR/NasT family two-component response regulator
MDYLMKPVLPRHLPEVIARARERFGRYQQVREGAASDEDALAIWVVVQAAVGMLVEQAAVSEPVAFERLRGRASTSERTLRAEAQAVFDAADEGGPAG